jgi:adenosine deaminase
LSGDEIQYPQELFRKAFKEAKAFNIRRTAHAGEAVGPPSIWNAIQYLEIDRIDHGTRAIEDDDLVEYLAEKQIPLTQCITSNLKLKVVSETVKHPFGKFLRKGLLVTLNTDDPQVFGTQLIDEYLLAARAFDLNAVDLEKIVLNGIKASFINIDEKEKLLRNVKSEIQHLKAELKFV